MTTRFPRSVPKSEKVAAGRSDVSATPLTIRSRTDISPRLKAEIRERISERFAALAPLIQRITVRFDDINGPKGGEDTLCRIEVRLSGMEPVVADAQAETADAAFGAVARKIERAARHKLSRANIHVHSAHDGASADGSASEGGSRRRKAADKESLIDHRVGTGSDALGRAIARRRSSPQPPLDTETGPSRRNAGRGSTAARNAKTNTAGMTALLEDSATKPSRKSTRGSANGAKSGGEIQKTVHAQLSSPKARATRATARAQH